MPLQNRVDPWGRIHAVPNRGTMMGNRGGKFHRNGQTLGRRRWASRHWICCELHYKDAHHEPMGQGYTSLFFLDEVTALAAGHRPCFFCRRADAKRFFSLMPHPMKVDEADRIVHEERLTSSSRRKPGPNSQREDSPTSRSMPDMGPGFRRDDAQLNGKQIGNLPSGAMIAVDNQAFAVRGPHLLPWSFADYGAPMLRISIPRAMLLTPPLYLGILAKGYQPRWHESAFEGEL